MNTISAPYNFVPLSKTIVIPEWGKQVSHDHPFRDGYSGEIHYTLKAETPLLVGGEQEKNNADDRPNTEVYPFRLPDGRYAIPGSSLKGMLRSVVEIAGFGHMRMVDDQALSVRDLTRGAQDIYGKKMTRIHPGQIYEAKPRAGWLEYDSNNNRWQITACDYARVEHDELAAYSGDDWWNHIPREPLARTKYNRWNQGLAINFDLASTETHRHSRVSLRYKKATHLGRGEQMGTLVFTGQPAARIRGRSGRKHLEFIFFGVQNKKVTIPQKVWGAFTDIYSENTDWLEFWRTKRKIPVFYLTDSIGNIQSLGLSLMYRLPYQLSIHEAIQNTNSKHLEVPHIENFDISDLLFGAISSKDQDASIRARVSVETAIAGNDIAPIDSVDTILNGPKSSYYPNYIQQDTQDDAPGKLTSETYTTLMDPNARIRGFKRYPSRTNEQVQPQQITPDQQNNCAVQIRLHPLPEGSEFEGRIIFHNLRPVELGALLWAMTWGQDEALVHGLGMGKSFGYGQTRLLTQEDNSYAIPNDPAMKPSRLNSVQIQSFISSFTEYMESKIQESGGWKGSLQLQNLLSMADPSSSEYLTYGMELRHMRLDGDNEFKNAKNNQPNPLALADYATAIEWPTPVARERWRRSNNQAVTKDIEQSNLHPWIVESLMDILGNSNAQDIDALMRHNKLYKKWSNIEESGLKKEILIIVIDYWKQKGWWSDPGSKTMKKLQGNYERYANREAIEI